MLIQGMCSLVDIAETLKWWINKQDKKNIEEESNMVVSEALEVVFHELKLIFEEHKSAEHF